MLDKLKTKVTALLSLGKELHSAYTLSIFVSNHVLIK